MRPSNVNVIPSQAASINGSGSISTDQVFALSAQLVASATATGTFKLQASDDLVFSPNAPTNWSDIPSATVSVSGAGAYLIPKIDVSYQFVQAVFTSTATGIQTIALTADVAGSLNNTYFLLQDEASVHKYYVWFNINSAGTDPAIAGRTAVPITGATNATAATLGAAVAAAIAALNSTNSFTTSGGSTVIVTNKTAGPFVAMTDGATPTGFTFAVTAGGGTVTASIKSLGM